MALGGAAVLALLPAGVAAGQEVPAAEAPVAAVGQAAGDPVGGANGVDQADFQMPFACGEVWGASTHGDHPAVDWNGVGPAAGPADQGLPVLAGLGGTVLAAGEQSGYGTRVIVDHGDGWTTLYAHLSAIWVAPGQQVAMGTLVGSVGNTGTSAGSHLHWEQRYLGQTVPVLLADGVPISTTYGSPGPTYISANCTENAYGVSLVPRPDDAAKPDVDAAADAADGPADSAPSDVPAKRAFACAPAGSCGAG